MVASEILYSESLSNLLPHRVLESLKAGIRLPEARFANLALASKGQRSVYLGIFKAADNVSEQPIKEFVGNTPDMK